MKIKEFYNNTPYSKWVLKTDTVIKILEKNQLINDIDVVVDIEPQYKCIDTKQHIQSKGLYDTYEKILNFLLAEKYQASEMRIRIDLKKPIQELDNKELSYRLYPIHKINQLEKMTELETDKKMYSAIILYKRDDGTSWARTITANEKWILYHLIIRDVMDDEHFYKYFIEE